MMQKTLYLANRLGNVSVLFEYRPLSRQHAHITISEDGNTYF